MKPAEHSAPSHRSSSLSGLDLADKLIVLFNATFAAYNTCLQGAAAEPLYRPADDRCPHHRVIFTRDYAASAQHEIAHWCLAGPERRKLLDYGYWYLPDGRNAEEQGAFEHVEVKPQALEWLFSQACGMTFRVSADNLDSTSGPSLAFKRGIIQQAQHYCGHGLNVRARMWLTCLQENFQVGDALNPERYTVEILGGLESSESLEVP